MGAIARDGGNSIVKLTSTHDALAQLADLLVLHGLIATQISMLLQVGLNLVHAYKAEQEV